MLKNINIGRQFITAKVLGTKDIIRQGVKVFEDEGSIIVVGIDATYKCDKSYVFVPYRELSGEAKRLADGMGVTR